MHCKYIYNSTPEHELLWLKFASFTEDTAMANTGFPNLCELFQIINNVGYKGSFLEPLAMTQMETQGENKGELPIKKYQTDLDISELEIF